MYRARKAQKSVVFALAMFFLRSLVFISIFVCYPLLAPAMSASSVAFAIHYDSPLFMFQDNMVLGAEVIYPTKIRFYI